MLIAFTLPIGIGIAVAGTLMPTVVKGRLAHRPASATGIYASGIQFGSALAAALAIPLADLHGGWRFSLGVFSVAAALSAAAWLGLTDREERPRTRARPPRMPLRSPTAWVVSLVFAMIGVCFYGVSAWLADAYVEHGWSEGQRRGAARGRASCHRSGRAGDPVPRRPAWLPPLLPLDGCRRANGRPARRPVRARRGVVVGGRARSRDRDALPVGDDPPTRSLTRPGPGGRGHGDDARDRLLDHGPRAARPRARPGCDGLVLGVALADRRDRGLPARHVASASPTNGCRRTRSGSSRRPREREPPDSAEA